jgi:hypothetical protein
MEMSQINTLHSYLKQKKMSLKKNKNGEQEGKTGPVWGIGTSGRGKDIRKGCRRVNMVEILMYVNAKNKTC